MSTTIINVNSFIDGQAIDLAVLTLEDATGTYGLRRSDTAAIIHAAGTVIPRIGVGTYRLSFTDPAADLIYDHVLKIVYGGTTYYYPRLGQAGLINYIYALPTVTHYSSQAEVLRLMGENAVSLMTEDWESTDTSPVWTFILNEVGASIDLWINQFYRRADILNNSYIRMRATFMAAHLLSQRRGNPALYQRKVDQIYEEFSLIRAGQLHIPGAVPFASNRPVVRNYMMQPVGYHPQRVQHSKSMGAAYNAVDYAYEPYLFAW